MVPPTSCFQGSSRRNLWGLVVACSPSECCFRDHELVPRLRLASGVATSRSCLELMRTASLSWCRAVRKPRTETVAAGRPARARAHLNQGRRRSHSSGRSSQPLGQRRHRPPDQFLARTLPDGGLDTKDGRGRRVGRGLRQGGEEGRERSVRGPSERCRGSGRSHQAKARQRVPNCPQESAETRRSRLEQEIRERYPDLRVILQGDHVVLRGSFPLIHEVRYSSGTSSRS